MRFFNYRGVMVFLTALRSSRRVHLVVFRERRGRPIEIEMIPAQARELAEGIEAAADAAESERHRMMDELEEAPQRRDGPRLRIVGPP